MDIYTSRTRTCTTTHTQCLALVFGARRTNHMYLADLEVSELFSVLSSLSLCWIMRGAAEREVASHLYHNLRRAT